MLELKYKHCSPLTKPTDKLDLSAITVYKSELMSNWQVSEKNLKKKFQLESFQRAIAFVQKIAMIAEKENHHPDICIRYTTVEVILSTHDVGGLTENDFILAAKIEDL